MTDTIAREVTVHGRVQGVNFRAATAREAQRRGVAGWVRNTRQGTVEAHFEGPPDAVASLLSFLDEGPRAADVDRVQAREAEPEGLEEFEVRP